jgi:CubicO group peptidase (beta-lactamase class C family)
LPNWRGHEPGGKLLFAFEPGTQWKYSGEGFEYLRQALEHKFHIPIEKLADSLVFKPFGMTDTRFYWDNTMDSMRFAHRYHADGTPFEWETWNTANPSNLLLTTVEDYGKFGIGVIKGAGLSKSVWEEMITEQTRRNNNKEFGLGWVLVKGLSNGEYALFHSGRNPGINTIVILLPQSKRGIVVFTNGEQGDVVYKKIISDSFAMGREIMERMR